MLQLMALEFMEHKSLNLFNVELDCKDIENVVHDEIRM